MASSRGILRSHGVLYPALFGKGSHVSLPWWLMSGKVSHKELAKEINSKDQDIIKRIVVSAEDFCLLDDFSFVNLLRDEYGYEVEVSLYLKEQVSWLESWYNQHVKWPWQEKFSGATPQFFFENISDFFWIDYSRLLDKILSFTDQGGLYVNVVDSSGVKDTVSDFLSHIGIDPRWLNSYEDRNASLSTAKLDILRRVNLSGVGGGARSKILSALDELDVVEDDDKKIIFNDKQALKIVEKFRKSNKDVARKYFNRDVLFSDPQRSQRAPSFVTEEKAYKDYIPTMLKMVAAL